MKALSEMTNRELRFLEWRGTMERIHASHCDCVVDQERIRLGKEADEELNRRGDTERFT